ncbi:MAG TPA: hypothetical protein DCY07_01250 [Rhodospirillaceae bacterium]|nr:hypothetical protein [Rhodospirillaceae bacterium]
MLNMQFLKLETSIAWMRSLMPQGNAKNTTNSAAKAAEGVGVRLMENGAGDGEAIYLVGDRLVHITFGDDPVQDDLFVTTITNGYVATLQKERSYFVPETFEIDPNTKKPVALSKEDERLLIEHLAKGEKLSIANCKKRKENSGTYRTVGTYFSTENGVVYANPETPDSKPPKERDRRLTH